MKTRYNTLLVLVPHRDTRLVLRKWSDALFAAGYAGAWSFPWAAPLAVLSRPLEETELKHCAAVLRLRLSEDKDGGKIKTAALGADCVIASVAFPITAEDSGENTEKTAILGPLLELRIPESEFKESAAEKITYRFPKLLLGSCLIRKENLSKGAENGTALPPLPAFSFRAAALANMNYYPLPQTAQTKQTDVYAEHNNYSFGWRIGKFHWLPRVKGKRHG